MMIDDFVVRLVKHSKINDSLINKLVDLKQQHWAYSHGSQIEWLNVNMDKSDYHLFVLDSSCAILAYLNLVNRKVNGTCILGIGNVCVSKEIQNSGLGTLLIDICKYYSKQLTLDLVLLCKTELVIFYEKCGFYKYTQKAYINDTLFNNCVMFSNHKYNSESEIHFDRQF